MVVTIYIASITAKYQIDQHQKDIINLLEGHNIQYKLVDTSNNKACTDEMRLKTGKPDAIAPQIFNEDYYCGDYEAFFNAVENKMWRAFFKLDSTAESKTSS